MMCGHRQNVFIKIIGNFPFHFFKFVCYFFEVLFIFFFSLTFSTFAPKQGFSIVAPSTIVVFVKNHAIPIDFMCPFVFQLDTACLVFAQKILKRSKTHNRAAFIRFFISQTIAHHKLPACKIRVVSQIFLPSILHRRLEGQNQNFLPSHLLRQLIRGKRLAETHFRVP